LLLLENEDLDLFLFNAFSISFCLSIPNYLDLYLDTESLSFFTLDRDFFSFSFLTDFFFLRFYFFSLFGVTSDLGLLSFSLALLALLLKAILYSTSFNSEASSGLTSSSFPSYYDSSECELGSSISSDANLLPSPSSSI
jgi:hypothetical protein